MKARMLKVESRLCLVIIGVVLLLLNYSTAWGAAYFSDNMEGASSWTADAPWATTTTEFHSSTTAWTDSPATYYSNEVDVSLTLTTPVDLSTATAPQLVFWHTYQMETDFDYGNVEVSIDSGTNWVQLATFTGLNDWARKQVDLTSYAGQSSVLIRFRLVTDKTITWDGWTIDDVAIDEAPVQIADLAVANPTSTTLDLSWTASLDTDFASYQIYRSFSVGVTTADTLVTTIATQGSGILTFTDASLDPSTAYYYKVFVFDTSDLATGSKEASGTTDLALFSYPFFDDMEGSVSAWNTGAPWGITTVYQHSGINAWTDSPGTTYAAGVDTSLQMTIDLGPANMPVLAFWQRSTFDTNSDFGYVEVRKDGSSTWERIYFVTGTIASWTEERVDLSIYAGGKVDIRFRVIADTNSIQSDGWYIDDVSINETTSAALPYPFIDDMEGGATTDANWHTSSWELSTDKYSGTYAMTDSIQGDYGVTTSSHLITANTLSLLTAVHPQLSFWHKYDTISRTNNGCNNDYWASEYDYVYVYLSTFNGQSGTWNLIDSFTGSQGWSREVVDLSAWAGVPNVRIKFVIDDNKSSNNSCSYTHNGWTIDNVAVEEAPVEVSLTLTASNMRSVDLAWSQNNDADFAHYEIYRSSTAGVSRTDTLVASVSTQATVAYTDPVAMIQPGTYFYRIWVFDQEGNFSLASNEVQATYAVPNNSYPFTEDGEGGTGQWEWGTPWGITNATAHAGVNSWTDSPGAANYSPNADTSLTTFLDLSSGAASPVLSFWHKYSLEQGIDFVRLEVSVDDGATWSELRSFTDTETSWNQERVNLTSYTGNANLGLRFRLTSDGANQQDGWYMDDLIIQEEATSAGYPFNDTMESGIIPWFHNSTWGQVTLAAVDTHSGAADSIVWTDSPEGSYGAGDDTWLLLTIDLGSASMPVMTFWHKYGFEANGDFGYVEIKEVGPTSWQRIYFVTGTSPDWLQERIDLSNYAGKQVDLRFRLVANGAIQSDGWYIDDLTIDETAAGTIGFPFSDPMENPASAANWHSSSWDFVADPYNGSFAVTDSPQGNYGQLIWSELSMSNTISLVGTTHPLLSFWHKYETISRTNNGCDNDYWASEYDYVRVYLSTQKGQPGSWTQLASFTGSSAWTYSQLDLSAWVGLPEVRVKFVVNDNNSSNNSCSYTQAGWTIDDVAIEEAPVEVALNIDSSAMHSVSLSWSQNNEADFDRYELYRSDTPGVSRSDTLVTTVYGSATLTHVDPVSLIQPGVHYYRMWVWDTDGNVSMESNEVQATYTVPQNGYPFIEDGESGTGQWAWGTPWGLETLADTESYNGQVSTVWTDSPGGSYPADADTSLTTFVNLGGSSKPVLTFWHKYFLEEGADFVKLEVSIDNGQVWQQLRAISGVESSWNYERIDLGDYVGNTNLGLRFRLVSGSQNQNDGWFLDDLKIDEEPTQASYPFYADMESGEIPWFYDSPWGLTTLAAANTYSGVDSTVWTDSPGGSYASGTDSSLYLTIDLGTASMPLLTFWHRHALEQNNDFGYIEVTEHGVYSWQKLYFVTGTSPAWVQERVDLSGYAGKQVDIRFRLTASTNGVQSDGWYIDDISVDETGGSQLSYPFTDDMESGATADNWHTSSWSLVPDSNSGTYAMTDSPLGNYGVLTESSMTMANTISLQGAVHPQLSFWHKYDTKAVTNNGCNNDYWANEYDYARVYLSTFNGQPGTWTQIAYFSGSQVAWISHSVDLSSWAGLPDVRIKFVMDDNNSSNNSCSYTLSGWTIDDVRIGEDETIPSFIQMVSGNSQLGQTGVALANDLVVRVYDSDSIPRAGVLVNFVVTGGDGSLSMASATSDANGLISTSLTLGATPDVNTVTATINGTSETVTYSATGYAPGQAMTLGMISGDNQVNELYLALANPLVVKITDILGQPVVGIDVSFNVQSGDGVLTSTAPIPTDTNGLASDTLTLGASTGPTTVTAASAGLIGSPTTFVAHAVLTGGSLGDDDGDGMPNQWEDDHGLDSQDAADATGDGDSDGLSNLEEYSRGTDPGSNDTDNDGMEDGWEVQYGLDPLDPADASNDNDNDGASNLVEYQNGTVPTLVKHFSITGATSESMDFYGVITIDGVPAESGDEVAVVDPNGVICGQFTVNTTGSYGFMHVYKDDPNTGQDEGAEAGDELTFLIWDASAEIEISPTVSVISGTQPPTWTYDGDSANVDLVGAGVYSIPMQIGWNLVSFPIKTCFYINTQPTEPMLPGTIFQPAASIADILVSISGKYEVVRAFDSSGAHTYDPALPGFSDLEYIAGGYGYWVKMTAAGNLEVSGIKAKANDVLSLTTNWNLVGYWHPQVQYSGTLPQVSFPPDATVFTQVNSIDDILTSISGKYSVVRSFDSDGAHTYDPLLPAGFSDLGYLGLGYGMWIKMDTVGNLSF